MDAVPAGNIKGDLSRLSSPFSKKIIQNENVLETIRQSKFSVSKYVTKKTKKEAGQLFEVKASFKKDVKIQKFIVGVDKRGFELFRSEKGRFISKAKIFK